MVWEPVYLRTHLPVVEGGDGNKFFFQRYQPFLQGRGRRIFNSAESSKTFHGKKFNFRNVFFADRNSVSLPIIFQEVPSSSLRSLFSFVQ